MTFWHFKIAYSLGNNFICSNYKASNFLKIQLMQKDKLCEILATSVSSKLLFLILETVTLAKLIFSNWLRHFIPTVFIILIYQLFKMCNVHNVLFLHVK